MSLCSSVELGFVHGPVHVAPVHVPFARCLAHHELVVRRAPGVLPGLADERTLGGQNALPAAKRLLVQGGRVQVPVDASRSKNPESFETVRPLNLDRHADRLPSVKTSIVLVQSGSVNSAMSPCRRE